MAAALEMWAGVECTVNRVGGRSFDQLARTGHDRRPDDLDRLAGLGVRTVRYPVLWERHAGEPVDWSWTDARLGRLRDLGLRPVVGLVHHGSGPPPTALDRDDFAAGLAAFAAKVAERYPWVDAYTPVNEPLTTARFSGLYGHWYPHARSDAAFVRCLLNQCRAVAEAMRAVRRVRPDAALVQTEDLGQTHAPAPLAGQAAFENDRRWLSWDLLAGAVGRRHRLRPYLKAHGATDAELDRFRADPCPPDALGVNHYVTSERYLDDRLELYPFAPVGGNGRQRYVDTEAVRVPGSGAVGLADLLRQAGRRYGRPVVITEAHLGCTPDEQVRWLWDVWRNAEAARAAGCEVRAVTAWSVFGAYDWDSLVTADAGRYEPGAFDVRSDPPREMPLAGVVRDLAAGRPPADPALATPGWWQTPGRFLVPPHPARRQPSRTETRRRPLDV